MLTRGADFKMAASMKEKVYRVLEHAKTSSVTIVQRHFWTKFAKEAPYRHNIRRLVKQFEEMGCLCKGKSTGWPSVNNEVVENIPATYVRSPRKSTYRASRELNVPQATVWRMLRKHLQFKPYKFQMVQAQKTYRQTKTDSFAWICKNGWRSMVSRTDSCSLTKPHFTYVAKSIAII
jgi:hypothetical protein